MQPIQNKKKANVGHLLILQQKIIEQNSMLSFLRSKLQINCCLGLDFSEASETLVKQDARIKFIQQPMQIKLGQIFDTADTLSQYCSDSKIHV